jgi:hypothetical protein
MSVAHIGIANHADPASVAVGAMNAVYAALEECSPEQAVTQVTYNFI